jgi:hypothetical protein
MITSQYLTFQNKGPAQDTSQYLTFQKQAQPQDYQPILDLSETGPASELLANTRPFRIRPSHVITSQY